MELFIPTLPNHATSHQLKDTFTPYLARYGVIFFDVDKKPGRGHGNITLASANAAQRFLAVHGVPRNIRNARSREPILFQGRVIKVMESDRQPDQWLLESLRRDEAMQAAELVNTSSRALVPVAVQQTSFALRDLQCGSWDLRPTDNRIVFRANYTDSRKGAVVIGRSEAAITLDSDNGDQHHVRFYYHQLDNIAFGDTSAPGIFFTFAYAPRFYKVENRTSIENRMAGMSLGNSSLESSVKSRVLGVSLHHEKIAGASMVCRIQLANYNNLEKIVPMLKAMPRVATKMFNTHVIIGSLSEDPADGLARLKHELVDTARYGLLPFSILFQVEKLTRNAILPAQKVRDLLPRVAQLHSSVGLEATATALQKLSLHLKPAGHDMEASAHTYTVQSLQELLQGFASSYNRASAQNKYELAKRIKHIKLVHRIIITPTAVKLAGPEPEPANRVLRKYADHPDCLVRVVFQDENGDKIKYEGPKISLDAIHQERFKAILNGSIPIAGRSFFFLGFSHSSLRSQACWFMHPLIRDGGLAFAPQILKELGDFTKIRIPAKCAARIGQNFTDTNGTIDIAPSELNVMLDVERNGYTFSDGVGTISYELLERVWRVYGQSRRINPTVLQIRFQGAKGMVALDTRLQGSVMYLRPSQVKFEAPAARNLEICEAAFKPLPVFLNRGYIKILEDLGVPYESFRALQQIEFDKLKAMTVNGGRAATLLETVTGTRSTRMPAMLRMLYEIGLDYAQDNFLFKTVEIAVVSKLRELKYRGRIPVEQGATLHGIMDETGVLKEGEIFVVMAKPPGGTLDILVKDGVVVTRSPANHPGDVQTANAVDVPQDSPLRSLYNTVVFSQHGERDLPSRLGGGDLDGDIFNIIWDDTLIPPTTVEPAEYPRVKPLELDRDVRQSDMSDFFVAFMQSDQLGKLSNIHVQLADKQPDGTHSEPCKIVAAMASTAVDFSKTGIPVDMKKAPWNDKVFPDFMASSPRLILNSDSIDVEENDYTADRAFDDIDRDGGKAPYKYYTSQKTLGKLYRNIDENQFLRDLQQEKNNATALTVGSDSLLWRLFEYLQGQAHDLGVTWEHHLDLSADIQSCYYDNLTNTLEIYSPSPHSPLSEIEVFSGQILGRQGGAQGHVLRDLSSAMRSEFERIVTYIVQRIVRGDTAPTNGYEDAVAGAEEDFNPMALYLYDEREVEAFPRAMACLCVAMREEGGKVFGKFGRLESFAYVAAGTALREWERYRMGVGIAGALPMV